MKRKLHMWAFTAVLLMLVAFGIPLALSADAAIPRKEAGLQSFPVSASTTIYKGAMVCVDTDGYLVAAANTAGYKFAGIAYEQVDNSAGSDGDLNCRVHTTGVFQLPCTSITQAMVGLTMFVVDDSTVDETASNQIAVGTLVQYVSATSGWVDIGNRQTQRFYSEDGTASLEVDLVNGNLEGRQLQLKWHNHDMLTDGYVAEFKGDAQDTDAIQYGIDMTLEIEPGGGTPADRTSGGVRAVQGVARIGSGFTVTGGSDTALYGQFCNNGTINGTSYEMAGYMLIEDGGTWTALTGLYGLWIDSHLAQTISSGASYFLNITNNGATVWDAAINVYAGNKITNLLRIETASGMVTAYAAAGNGVNSIKVDIDGVTQYIHTYDAV